MILVGNKIDLRSGEVTNKALEDEIVPIMNEFKVSFVTSYQICSWLSYFRSFLPLRTRFTSRPQLCPNEP